MSFMDFGMAVDFQFEYDDYVEECKENGVEPLDIKTWWDNLE